MLTVNGDSHFVRYLEDRIFPVHGKGDFWLIKSLDIHEIILRDQQSTLEVRHEDTSAFHYSNLPFIVNKFTVKDSLMSCLQGGTNSVHETGMEYLH